MKTRFILVFLLIFLTLGAYAPACVYAEDYAVYRRRYNEFLDDNITRLGTYIGEKPDSNNYLQDTFMYDLDNDDIPELVMLYDRRTGRKSRTYKYDGNAVLPINKDAYSLESVRGSGIIKNLLNTVLAKNNNGKTIFISEALNVTQATGYVKVDMLITSYSILNGTKNEHKKEKHVIEQRFDGAILIDGKEQYALSGTYDASKALSNAIESVCNEYRQEYEIIIDTTGDYEPLDKNNTPMYRAGNIMKHYDGVWTNVDNSGWVILPDLGYGDIKVCSCGKYITDSGYELESITGDAFEHLEHPHYESTHPATDAYKEVKLFNEQVNRAAVKINGRWGFISEKGRFVIPAIYDEVDSFYGNSGIAAVMKGDKWGFIKADGSTLIPFVFEDAVSFLSGDYTFAKYNGKWGLINKNFTAIALKGMDALKNALVKKETVTVSTIVVTATGIKIEVNGKPMQFTHQPISVNGVVLVSAEDIFGALGAKCSYESGDTIVVAIKGDNTVTLKLGSNIADVNGIGYKLDINPVAANGKLMAPVRFVAQVFGFGVDWNDKTKTILID